MNNFEMNKNRRKRNSEDILCTWKFFQYFLLKFTKNNHFKGQNGADWVGSFFTKQPWHLCTCTQMSGLFLPKHLSTLLWVG